MTFLAVSVLSLGLCVCVIGGDGGAGGGGAKLSLPRALLPLAVRPPPLQLHASGVAGCYRWSSSRDDVVSLTEIEQSPGCSMSVTILSYPQLLYRQTAIVFAEDVYTKQILRCDIIVDKISYLEIITTTRELYVEEAPEAFEVRAYDDQGNEFTTLEGVEFVWTVVSSLQNNDVIRIITFSESSYEASSDLKKLEEKGLRGHTVLLEGVSTGTAKVTVRLPQSEYASIKSAEVTLRVVANLLVMPSDVSMLKDDSIKFKIIQVREGRLLEVSQPSSQYWLEILDSNIANLDKQTGIAIGKKLGTTKIILRDAGEEINPEDVMFRPPEANLRVVTAHSLQLDLRPMPTSRIWSVQCDSDVVIIVNILDNHGRKIHVGEQTYVNVILDETKLEVKWRSVNGTVLHGIARQIGIVPINATLISVAGRPVPSNITANGEINILNKIQVIPPHSILPWDPIFKRRSKIQLKATGGDGSYVWRSEGAVSVDPRGIATAQNIGNASIVASMPSNPYIFGTASVIVADPSKMEVVWYEEEGPVDSTLAIHIALFAELDTKSNKILPFDTCEDMPFKVVSVEGIFFQLADVIDSDVSPISPACAILHVICEEPGIGLIKIQLGKFVINLSLLCYSPLKQLYPSSTDSVVVLAVGSSLNTIFTGGPLSWFEEVNDKKPDINVSSPKTASVELYPRADQEYLHAFTVTCLEIGETHALITLFGDVGRSNGGIRKSASIKIDIHCSLPHSVKLSIKNTNNTCLSASSQLLMMSGEESMQMEISVFDKDNLKFHNATSLRAKITSKPLTILQNAPQNILTKISQQFSNIPTVDYHYQELHINTKELRSKSGTGEISLEIVGYRESLLKQMHIKTVQKLETSPKSTIPFKLIVPVHISSEKVTIFNHPDSVIDIPILQGSGSFKTSVSNAGYAHISLDSSGRILKIQPYSDGSFSITIQDLCVASSTKLLVNIVSIASIVADMPELIEKEASVRCVVRFYDRSGSVIPARIDNAPPLLSRVIDGHVSVSRNVKDDNIGGVLYTVTGLEVGDANIEFTAGHAQGFVHAYVFPPLRLVPQNSVILPGGSVKITTIGGPPPPAIIKFKRNQGGVDVIDINNVGVVRGLSIGVAGIEAYAEGFQGAENIHAYAKVQVVPIEGIAIHAPTSTLLTGNTMPLWAIGIPDTLTPIELGSLKPALRFRWSVSGDGAVSVTDALSLTEIEFDDSDRVAVHLNAIHSGNVVIHLNVSTVPGSTIGKICGHSWYAKFDLIVIEPLQMLNPPYTPVHILLPPHSSIQLETNYDSNKVTYNLVEGASANQPLAKISPDGKVTTFGHLGFGVILVNVVDSQSSGVKQRVSMSFEVCSPHYSTLELDSNNLWSQLAGLTALPSGLTLPLKLSKHDIVGRKFGITSNNINHNSNRPDLIVAVGNSTQTQRLLLAEPGRTVVKLWDASSEKQFSDYLSLRIANSIHPLTVHATVGDVWCMRSAIKDAKWIENSSDAVWISRTGFMQARVSNVAASSIMLQPPPGLPFTTQATIITRPSDSIYFLNAENEHIVTDAGSYVVQLVLANHEESNKMNNWLFGEQDCSIGDLDYFPFSCEVKDLTNVASSEINIVPVFNKNQGTYGCQVTWTPDKGVTLSSVNDSLSLSLIARVGFYVSNQINLRCIQTAKISPENVILSPPPAYLAPIEVTAAKEVLDQVKVLSENEYVKIEGPQHISETSARYIVKANSQASIIQKANIRLVSPLTYQSDKISVIVNSDSFGGVCNTGGESSIMHLIQNYHMILMIIISVIVLLYSSLYIYFKFAPQMSGAQQISNTTLINPDSSHIRNLPYQSMSPLSPRLPVAGSTPQNNFSTSGPQISPNSTFEGSNTSIYGDPSFLAPAERRRNRRFL